MMSELLVTRGLRKSYGDFVAVDGVDLSIPRGCVYGVLGPNGAGKSTIIRMIMGIYDPDGGSIEFDGAPRTRASLDRIAYLPEERGMYKKMPLLDHIVYLARLKGMDANTAREKASQWLERFDLGDRAEAKVDELSKGMQQKAQFIGAILPEPELIILDEPFSGLDPINVRLLTEIIREQKAAGRTVLFSTHVLEQAEKICDRIFLIHRGLKVLDGDLEEIRDSYPVENIELRGSFELDELDGLPGVEGVSARDGMIQLRMQEGADRNALLQALLSRGQVDHFSGVRPSLTDIFIREVEASGAQLAEHELAAAGGLR
jgi:ABC-2 type transport system ATP-binding protein